MSRVARVALGAAACGAAVAVAPLVGGLPAGELGDVVLWQLRAPRVAAGALVGGTLATVGAVYQVTFANPLATPSTVGTLAGATLGALLALVVGPRDLALPVVVAAAFAGALAIGSAVAAVAAHPRARTDDVLLAGIALSLAASAISTGLEYGADAQTLFAAAQWSLGRLPQVGWRGVLSAAPFLAASCGAALLLVRALGSLVAGADVAHAQGVHVARVRALAVGTGALGVAACVAWCGPIAFVGLIVPHLVRLASGSAAPAVVVPLSLPFGAAFLVVCDVLARTLLPGRDLPVGVLTAALGAPALLALLVRRR
ncbi:MAG: iron ABC transporter permease [Polyangiaceae bacterium]|nr:iron ABC transporter permease [Polyangiaceae bacterium]